MSDKRQEEALRVCRKGDLRCIEDPCPYGIWKVLCKPDHHKDASHD